MKEYKINVLQFNYLADSLRTTQTFIANGIGATQPTVQRHLSDGNFCMEDLVNLCNLYRVRPSSLITTEEQFVSEDLMVLGDDWQPVRFDAQKILDRFKRDHISILSATQILHTSRQTLLGITKRSPQLSYILDICNTFAWNLGDFLTDKTMPLISSPRTSVIKVNTELEIENAQLRKEIEDLRALIRVKYAQVLDDSLQQVAEP